LPGINWNWSIYRILPLNRVSKLYALVSKGLIYDDLLLVVGFKVAGLNRESILVQGIRKYRM